MIIQRRANWLVVVTLCWFGTPGCKEFHGSEQRMAAAMGDVASDDSSGSPAEQGAPSGSGTPDTAGRLSESGNSIGPLVGGAGRSGETPVESNAPGQEQESESSPLLPTRLRVELLTDPLGIQTGRPRLSWELESSDARARGEGQSAYEIVVASSLAALAEDTGNLWSSGFLPSTESNAVYAGQELGSFAHAFWKVRVRDAGGRVSPFSAPSEWTTGLLDPSDWGAQWITGNSAGSLPIFRREFSVTKPVTRALLAMCGLGQFEARVNGSQVSDAVLEPAFTNYAKSCHYSTYDVTRLLVPGANALGVLLGNGMYSVAASARYTKFTGSFGPPKLIARLQIEYADATETTVVTDTGWRVNPGPVTFSNVYGGEDFDARLEPAGWDMPGFVDGGWAAAAIVPGAGPALLGRSSPALKVMQAFVPVRVTQPRPGVYVYDLGQNFSGWPEITLRGASAAPVRMTPGELLDGTGLVSQASTGGPVTFSYTPSSPSVASWHPRFSSMGFRYVQVDGAVAAADLAAFPGRPELVSLTGKFVYSSVENVGSFTSSDDDLNRIHELILAAVRSNLQSILTDCPHRERLGWLETSHLLARSIAFNFDVAAFYEKILRDMRDAQTDSGFVPNIAPEYTVFAGSFRDSPEWGSAFAINPWFLYQMYGDRQPLDEHYANMLAYVNYLGGKAVGNIVSYGLGDWYDIGPAAPGASQLTSPGVTSTAIWLQSLEAVRQTALVLGRTSDADRLRATIATVSDAFNARFLTPAGNYDRNSQTANAMPLALGLVPPAARSAVLASLVASVSSAQNRVTAGDIGFLYLVRALSDAGRSDVFYALLEQATAPGYLYQIARGATALTEAWDAGPRSSQNHAMLGHAEEWLYSSLGGIKPDPAGPGFKKFIVEPQPPAGLGSVDARYHSVRGLIRSRWDRLAAGGLAFEVTVPVNTTATVTIPTAHPAAVTEGGLPAMTAPGVISAALNADALQLQVGSGEYRFVAP